MATGDARYVESYGKRTIGTKVLWNHHFSWKTNISCFGGKPLPTNLCPYKCLYNFFNIYQDHPEDATNEFRPHEQGKI